MTTLLDTDAISIVYDTSNEWLYVDWKGIQNKESVEAGCQHMLSCLRLVSCSKILNDNTHVTGDWEAAAQWVGKDFIPQLAEAGLVYGAWVYSPNCLGRRAVDKALLYVTHPVIVSFDDVASAYTWLRERTKSISFQQ